MNMDTFITIKQGMEYQAHEENIYQKNSFFALSYRHAANCLQEIIDANNYFYDKAEKLSDAPNADAVINKHLLGYPNNIIAFCAERGQGKTSAMLSFAKALQEFQLHSACKEKEAFWSGYRLSEYQFVVINNIDPTTMEDQESIMRTVLSRMLNQFQSEWERRTNPSALGLCQPECAQTERLTLLNMFQKCYHNLQVMDNGSGQQDIDLLDQMMELGDSANMRGAMYRLIRKFLKFMCPNVKKTCLVIQIDDADFNIPRAYNIIDDIRRYLVLPQVLVLLSANMTQLETTVEQHFIDEYSHSIDKGGMASVERCHEIAERYISKVIPGYHRVYLPDLQKFLSTEYEHLQIQYLRPGVPSSSAETNILDAIDQSQSVTYYYQDQLLRFLYQRTGLLLMTPENFLHNFLPGNIRELTQFLAYFNHMDKLEINYFTLVDYFSSKCPFDAEKVNAWRNNLEKMETYLIELWAPVNLRFEGHTMLRILHNEADDNKNRHLLLILPDYYGREIIEFNQLNGASSLSAESYSDNFVAICREHGLSIYDSASYRGASGSPQTHASYADVCEALNILSSLPGSHRQYKLIYAIHLLYTIRLHLLLLNQVEMAAQRFHDTEQVASTKEPVENMLVNFLADVLYKRKDLKEEPRGFAHWQYEFSVSDLQKVFLIKTTPIQVYFSMIANFCRRIEHIGYSYISLPIRDSNELKNWTDADGPLRFNFFYSHLLDLDLLSDANSVERDQYRLDPELRNKMAGSIALLLNWDVQYALLRNLRRHKIKVSDVFENMYSVYAGKYTQSLLDQLVWLTDLPEYKEIFNKLLLYAKQKTFGYAIQCAVPDFRMPFLRRLEKKVKSMSEKVAKQKDRKPTEELEGQRLMSMEGIRDDMSELRKMITPLFGLQNQTAPELTQDTTLDEMSKILSQYKGILSSTMTTGAKKRRGK